MSVIRHTSTAMRWFVIALIFAAGPAYSGSASIKLVPNKLGNVRLVVPGPGGGRVVCIKPSVLGESIPCCKSDAQGCICSSDDCEDCKDVTRDTINSAAQMKTP